jgi:hypothetical protein
MQSAVLRALEFDRIVELVRGFAITPMGDELLARLAPSSDPQEVAQRLAATTETTKYLAANNLFPLRASADLPQTLAALAVEGRALEPARLFSLAAFWTQSTKRRPPSDAPERSRISRQQPGPLPRSVLKPRRSATKSIRRATSSMTRVPSQTRERLRKQRSRLRGRSSRSSAARHRHTCRIWSSPNGTGATCRHQGRAPLVHPGTSTARPRGASLFSSLSTVEINNDIVALLSRKPNRSTGSCSH